MIDNLAIAISHALLALAVWRLAHSDALDADPGTELADRTRRKRVGEDTRRG
jgi:hypothetical protein